MDVNYSRWMSKDPDAAPEEVEDEPGRFSLPKPPRSVVASGVMVALVVLGVGAVGRSLSTSDASSDQETAVATPSTQESSGPGAAGVEEDTTLDDSPIDDSPIADDGIVADDSETYDIDDDRVMRQMEHPRMPMRHRIRPGPPMPGPPPGAHVEIRSIDEDDSDDSDDEDD